MKKKILIICVLSVFFSCSPSNPNGSDNTSEKIKSDSAVAVKTTMSEEEINNIIESIPSPLEFSSLIENTGTRYDQSFLNSTNNASNYNSQYSKAINLGVYGADLGYINIYHKTFSAIDYLNTVYQLSTDLKIGDYFDFNTLKRLAINNKNLDSIVYITTKSFENMHIQLKKNGNSEISTLILLGGWVEGIYLTSSIVNSSKSSPKISELMLTVYDEHIVLDDVIKLADSFKGDPNIEKVTLNLKNLKMAFSLLEKQGVKDAISVDQFNTVAQEIYKIRNELVK